MAENLTPTEGVPPFKRFKLSKSEVTAQDAMTADPQKKLSFGGELGKVSVFGQSMDA